ncbi:MAG: hypothetical protein WBX15_15855, partial [Thermoanaerobaculia bacterium]
MITYVRQAAIQVRQFEAPQAPFWTGAAVSPYSKKRSTPLSLDLIALTALSVDRAEVAVATPAGELLARDNRLSGALPVLVDATGRAELTFRRGREALEALLDNGVAAVHLTSADGVIPVVAHASSDMTLCISTWPLLEDDLQVLFQEAGERSLRWG